MKYPADGPSPAENAEYRRRVEALLRGGELYFATAKELNDPFDAAPHFRIPSAHEELLKAVERGLAVFGERNGLRPEQIEARREELKAKIKSGEYEIEMTGVAHGWREEFRSKFPMCCLTAERGSTLMWSYYAEGHTGICVHFDATQVPFGNAEKVVYVRDYPEIPLPLGGHDPNEFIRKALYTKSDAWSHEREYRLVNLPYAVDGAPGHILDDIFGWKTPQLAIISPAYIEGVTVGAAMREHEIEDILRLCADRARRIPVFRAKCSRDHFELEFERISE